jgi:hypothetical protein
MGLLRNPNQGLPSSSNTISGTSQPSSNAITPGDVEDYDMDGTNFLFQGTIDGLLDDLAHQNPNLFNIPPGNVEDLWL